MNIELTLSNVPQQRAGFCMMRRHYHNHIVSLWLFLGHGWKIDLTILKSDELKFKVYRFINYT